MWFDSRLAEGAAPLPPTVSTIAAGRTALPAARRFAATTDVPLSGTARTTIHGVSTMCERSAGDQAQVHCHPASENWPHRRQVSIMAPCPPR